MAEIDTIIGLVTTAKACRLLAKALREEIGYGKESWEDWRPLLLLAMVAVAQGLPANVCCVVGALAAVPYSDLPLLVATLEADSEREQAVV